MLTLMTHVPMLFNPEDAVIACAKLTAGEECGWSYSVKHGMASNERCLIEVFDDEGVFIDYF